MKKVTVYGIKNCDSMKKTFVWLDGQGIAYDFHDYKKDGVDAAVIKRAISQHGWENVINRRGTTWRKLDDVQRENMNDDTAVAAAIENPSLLKRPLITVRGDIFLGFQPENWII